MKTEGMAIERYLRRPLPTRRDLVAVLFRQRRVILGMFALAVLAVLSFRASMDSRIDRGATDGATGW